MEVDEFNDNWFEIRSLFAQSPHKVNIIESQNDRAFAILAWAQIDSRTKLGAVILNCDEIIVDDWVHLLGHGKGVSGQTVFKLSNLHDSDTMKNAIVVATDVLGGLFAVNQDRYSEDFGYVFYLQPECLEWEPAYMDYSDFLEWLATEDLNDFYEDVRWMGWRELAMRVNVESAIKFSPEVWYEACNFAESPRQIVSFKQQLADELTVYLQDN